MGRHGFNGPLGPIVLLKSQDASCDRRRREEGIKWEDFLKMIWEELELGKSSTGYLLLMVSNRKMQDLLALKKMIIGN